MATIIPYKNGWRAQVCVKSIRDSKTFRTKTEAKTWAEARGVELRALKTSDPGELHTVREMLEQYDKTVVSKSAGGRPEGLRIKAFLRDYPHLAELNLASFSTPHLAQWRDDRATKVKPASVNREMCFMRSACSLARKEWHWMKHNPFDGLRVPQDGPPRTRRVDPWKEVRPIVRALGYITGRAPQTKSQEVALAFLLALRTSMRAGEIRQLGKQTLNLSRRTATVNHKMQYKTQEPRVVPLTRQAIRLLLPVADREQIFTLSDKHLDALFRKTRDRLLIKGLHFHDSRAEAITRLAKKVDVLTLSKISGHADLKMLSRVYYRETPEQIAARL